MIPTHGKDPPVTVGSFAIGRHADATELSFELTAGHEATLFYGSLKRVSRDGRTVRGREDILSGALRNTVVDVTSTGGPLELAIDAGDRRVARFTTTDERPASYSWKLRP